MTRLLGGLLLAVGLLVMLLSGLCSGVFLVSMLGSGGGGELLSMLLLILVVGGIPFALGLGCFFGGRALLRIDDRQR